jgi:hypothetical protein
MTYTILGNRNYNHNAYSCVCCVRQSSTSFYMREENGSSAASWIAFGWAKTE